ncbi:MAG: hypothetical protein NVSMB5_06510 [Candidatus Velthaea sp.]
MNFRSVTQFLGGSPADDAAPDALALIHSDHEEVSTLFKAALEEKVPAAQRRKTIAQILDALTLHAKMEEKIFYPALRKAGGAKEKDSVLEAAEEHGLVKDLIAKIKRVETRDETLIAKLTVLKEIVEHHVKEEESEMFSEARRVMGAQLESLGELMQNFKDRNGADRTGAKAGRKKATRTPVARKAAAKPGRKKATR